MSAATKCVNHNRVRSTCSDSKCSVEHERAWPELGRARARSAHSEMGLRVAGKRDIVPAIRHVPALIPVALPVDCAPRPPDHYCHRHGAAGLVSRVSRVLRLHGVPDRGGRNSFRPGSQCRRSPAISTGVSIGSGWRLTFRCGLPSSSRFSPAFSETTLGSSS